MVYKREIPRLRPLYGRRTRDLSLLNSSASRNRCELIKLNNLHFQSKIKSSVIITNMDLTNIDTINNLLKEESTSPQKQFGQNFLLDKEVLQKLVEGAEITNEDIVVEVGPGIGTVTKELAEQAEQVYTFEIDKGKLPVLARTLKKYSNVSVINQDFLQVHFEKFLKENEIKKYKFVSSLPYNISKKILQILLETKVKPAIISVLIQKEVAEKYVPKKPDKQTFLSNYLQLFAKGEIVHTFGPESFFPAPTVNSAILKIIVDKEAKINRKLVRFIKSGFSRPRKKVSNVLAGVLHKETGEINEVFNIINLPENSRAENLSIDNWKVLFNQLKKNE